MVVNVLDAQIHVLTITVFFCQTECLLSFQVTVLVVAIFVTA
jgi:hypothetical protein